MSRAAGGGRLSRLWAASAVLALLLSSCGGSRYHYLSSTSTHTFLKVPSSWQVFQQKQILAHLDVTDPTAAPQRPFPFFVVFDADPSPFLDHNVRGNYPLGVVRVRTLSADERDTFSMASLRNEFVPVDQVLQSDPNAVSALTPPTSITHGGLRGSHLEFTVQVPSGGSFTYDQIGLVDAATHTVWLLVVGCNTTCYRSNEATIHRVADSWTVKGK